MGAAAFAICPKRNRATRRDHSAPSAPRSSSSSSSWLWEELMALLTCGEQGSAQRLSGVSVGWQEGVS